MSVSTSHEHIKVKDDPATYCQREPPCEGTVSAMIANDFDVRRRAQVEDEAQVQVQIEDAKRIVRLGAALAYSETRRKNTIRCMAQFVGRPLDRDLRKHVQLWYENEYPSPELSVLAVGSAQDFIEAVHKELMGRLTGDFGESKR